MSDETTPPAGADERLEAHLKQWKERWAGLRAEFETEFDELRVKAHLGKEDAKDEWEKLEARFKAFAQDLDEKGDDVEDIVEEKLKGIAAELKDGIERLRKLF